MAGDEYVPQLTTLVKTPPSGDGWLHEIKLDGYRIGAANGEGGKKEHQGAKGGAQEKCSASHLAESKAIGRRGQPPPACDARS